MFQISENPMVLDNGIELKYVQDVDGANYVFKIMDSRVPFDEDKWEKTVFDIDTNDPTFKILKELENELGVSIVRTPKDPKYKHTISIKKCLDVQRGRTYKAVYFNAFVWENVNEKTTGVSLRFVKI